MTFSVVTISFNQRSYLDEALNSVLSQSHPDIEYIVVDPGSTDGSRELILEYSKRISRIVFEPDQGPPDGLNKGFQHASGEIFCFLNSDDVFLPEAFAAVNKVFEENPDCDIVMGGGFIVDANGKRLRRIRAAGFTIPRYFYGAATWLQQSTFFRRQAFDSVGGFNAANRSCWDGELIIDMMLNGAKVKYLNQDLSLFRVHTQSITGSKRHKQMMKADADRMFVKAIGRGWNVTDTLRSRLLRVERVLTHPGAFESAIKARIHGL